MKREYPEQPIVGVGAILFQEESVLLIKRGREPARGQWSIPGGVVDLGETLQAAVAREALEETHLEVEPFALVKVLDRIFRDKEGRVAYHYVLVDFLCRYKGGEVRPGSDALEARFVPVAELALLNVIPATREVIYQAARLLKNPQVWDQAPHLKIYSDLSGDQT
ncbi:MAG: NUDIX domain-containing protein [Deltaproteobacteria bacterium]|nr:MAG: NUDIX domain-containing protein [Deltaproteobacteria bacterium]